MIKIEHRSVFKQHLPWKKGVYRESNTIHKALFSHRSEEMKWVFKDVGSEAGVGVGGLAFYS